MLLSSVSAIPLGDCEETRPALLPGSKSFLTFSCSSDPGDKANGTCSSDYVFPFITEGCKLPCMLLSLLSVFGSFLL